MPLPPTGCVKRWIWPATLTARNGAATLDDLFAALAGVQTVELDGLAAPVTGPRGCRAHHFPRQGTDPRQSDAACQKRARHVPA